MSATVDQRVVEMRFDNRQFESGVSTTMSTLDKLKQKLKLSGASKGLEEIDNTARRMDFSMLGNALGTVQSRFSALQVAGVTALANITNSAVNAGKRIVSALTIDPIKTGFNEYETKMGSIQTILANTQHEGTNLDDVTAALEALNQYADKTIYNFQEMTRNIGTFTAAGVSLDSSVKSIQGIANLAAISGSTSQQASTAMYQLSQALSAGRVTLQDWNSVVNAGMGGKVFQDALVRTAAAMKGISEETFRAQNITTSFRDSISSTGGKQTWLSSEVLIKTLEQFTMAAEEGSKEWEEFKKTLMASGYTEKQAEEILKMANTATDAATKVKTFTQLLDTLKESAQSGWAQTWELIVGDFEEAKAFFTELSDMFGGIIGKSAENRNALLGDTLSSNWDKLISKINEADIETSNFEDSIRKVVGDTKLDSLIEECGSLEAAVRKGKISSDDLKTALANISNVKLDGFVKGLKDIDRTLKFGDRGEDVKKLQTALKELGYELGAGGIDGVLGSTSVKAIKEFQKANGLKITGVVDEKTLAALEKAGTKVAEIKGGVDGLKGSCEDLIDTVTETSGRELLLDSLMNVIKAIQKPLSAVNQALHDVFDIKPTQLYDAIKGLNKFTESLIISDESAEKVRRAFKGFFSIFDIGRKVLVSFGDALLQLLGSDGVASFGTFLLDTLASLGDFFVSLNEGFDTAGLTGLLSTLASGIGEFFGIATGSIESFGDVLVVAGNFIAKVAGKIWESLKTVFGWVSENFSAGDIFAGLAGGGVFVLAKKLIKIIDSIKEAFENLFGNAGDSARTKFSDILDSVNESLTAFTSGIKVGSVVAIAVAVGILSASLKTISEIDAIGVGKGLFAIGTLLAMLSAGFSSMTKTLTAFNSKGIVKSSFALILVAAAVKVLVGAMEKIAALNWEEIAKGLVGVGGGLLILCGGLKILNGSKVSLGTSIAMLALAEACDTLGDAMKKFAGFSWDEIGRGLAAMGGALGEMVIALSVLSKVGGFGALLGSVGILIASKALDDMAEALKSFAEMNWSEIGRGIVAMGGALGEVAVVTGLLGKLAGFSSIFASGAILIVVQGLGDLSTYFKEFGNMAWDEIGRGFVGMGAALGEVAIVIGLLGKLAGFSSIFASGAILIVVQGLSDLVASFKEFGAMGWDEIGRGFVAMGSALGEVAVIIGVLGTLAGFSSIFASGALLLVIQGLDELAVAFQNFGAMPWDEIRRGLVAMGGALGEVAVIAGVLGSLAGLPALLGGGAILLAVQGLGDLADALKKFGEMSWDEIGRGLAAMGAALTEISIGSILNTFSGFGAGAIAELAAPLGVLADSVNKWKDVTVPEGLSENLKALAAGVKAFTFGGLGAGALAEAAPAVGTMADSVKKWSGVEVPDNLGTSLETLATGVKAFTFGGSGAGALAEAAPAVGTMADSVKKWVDIVFPENLGTNLQSLGTGVHAFTFGGSGAGALAEAAPGVGSMADAVKKWVDVVVPDNLGTSLSSLATGVKAFTFGGSGAGALTEAAPSLGVLADSVKKWANVVIPDGFVEKLDTLAAGVKQFTFGGSGAETISTCAAGLGTLADSVTKWTGVVVPEDLGTNLSTLATGVKAFTFGGSGADTLSVAATGVGAMSDAVKKWVGVEIPDGFSENLSALSTAIKNISGVEDIAGTASELESLKNAVSGMGSIKYETINNGLSTMHTALTDFSSVKSTVSGLGDTICNELINPLKEASSDMKTVGSGLIDSLTSGINSMRTPLTTSVNSTANTILNIFKTKYSTFKTIGSTFITKLASGIKASKSKANSTIKSAANEMINAIKDKYDSMYEAGEYLGEGLIKGIEAKEEAVYEAAKKLGEAAVKGELDGQKSASPSKATIQAGKWFGEGLIIGIDRMGSAVREASSSMGSGAVKSVSKTISRISELMESDIDAQPTIRPVLDLSNVESGAGYISSLLDSGNSVGVMANVSAISGMMSRRGQNGAESEVVMAINKLRRDLGNVGNTTYNVNGVTYDDGSNVSGAVKELIRAARIERRV